MRKIFPILTLLSLLIFPAVSFAQTRCVDYTALGESGCLQANCIWNPVTNQCVGVYIGQPSDVITIINRIGNWIFAILLAVAGIMLILAGFFWVTAGGEPANVMKARQMLTNAVIGLVIALLAKGMVMAVLRVLGA